MHGDLRTTLLKLSMDGAFQSILLRASLLTFPQDCSKLLLLHIYTLMPFEMHFNFVLCTQKHRSRMNSINP